MAKLLIDQMPDNTSAQDFDRTWRLQPSSIEQAFARVMELINGQSEGDAALGRRVLSEILVAHEPMKTRTLLDVAASDAGWERTFDQVQIDKRIARCVQCCGGLVHLVARDDGNVVVFVHYTVRNYLETHGVSNETQR
jgi:hypothetical protein